MIIMKRLIIFIFFLAVLFTTIPAVQAVTNNSASLSGVQIFPKDHIWNVPVDNLPVDARSSDYISTIGPNSVLYGYIGFPYNVVDSSVPHVNVTSWGEGAWDADKVPAPFPENAMLETECSDHHLFIVDRDENAVYEFYHAAQAADGTWSCDAEVRWNFTDYRIMPDGWGSADAAGMAMLPGLLRYDEVNSGTIAHALRVTLYETQNAHVWPATHHDGVTDPRFTPNGQRFRLKASFDTSGYSPQIKTILEALKTYGVMVADNIGGSGGEVDLSVVPDSRWDYNTLKPLKQLKASDFEAVDVTSLMISRNSGQARITPVPIPPTAQFAANITKGLAPLSVQFTDQSVSAGTTSYAWDMNNDGVIDHITKNPSHTFQEAGTYTVSLNVTNASGSNTTVKTRYITISSPLPVADFTGTPITGTAPLTVAFTDLSTNGPGTWKWTFGDGSAENTTAQNPIHTYMSTGSYAVSLNVTNAYGFSNVTKTGFIAVTRFPTTKIGVFRNGIWNVDGNGNGQWDPAIDLTKGPFGQAGDSAVAGVWNGNGTSGIGVFRNGIWYFDWNNNGIWDTEDALHRGYFGIAGDKPVVGNWTGDGISKIGVFRNGIWYVDWNGNGQWDVVDAAHTKGPFGQAGDIAVAGDWNGNGTTKIGVFRSGYWYIDWNNNGIWDAEDALHKGYFGTAGDKPVVGDWNGDGISEIGVFRNGIWYIDWNGNGAWDAIDAPHIKGPFGQAGDSPIAGNW